jgi:hypothetical protein
MRMSPLAPECALPQPKLTTRDRVHAAVGRLLTHWWNEEPAAKAVSERTGSLGDYIAERRDPTRIRAITVESDDLTTPLYRRDQIREYLRLNAHHRSELVVPQPRTIISIYGNGYGIAPADTDRFMCRFSVFDLDDGGRFVQAVPFEHKQPVYAHEHEGMEGSLHELFGSGPAANELRNHARINLGVFEEDGTFTEIRQFNHQAFGADLLPILDNTSAPDYGGPFSFSVLADSIREY